MAALQAAVQHAQNPASAPADLSAECRAAGVDALSIQSLVGNARKSAPGTVVVPGLDELTSALEGDIGAMIHAMEANDASASKIAADRLAVIKKQFPVSNEIEASQVAKMIAVPSGDADSLHRLIMDLHKTLNRLAASCAEEVVAGAHAHSLRPDDRELRVVRGVCSESVSLCDQSDKAAILDRSSRFEIVFDGFFIVDSSSRDEIGFCFIGV